MTDQLGANVQVQKSKSAMAIAGLVLGIVALLTSFVPIVNNLSFLVALLGLVFAIIGIVSTGANGKRSGRALAIAALVICIVAGAVVLGTQKVYSDAIDSATSGAKVTNTSNSTATSSSASSTTNSSSSSTNSTELSVGQSATLDNGLTVTVKEIKNVTNYDGSTLVAANIEYANAGSQGASYNTYDWKGQTSTGAQEYTTYYSGGSSDNLNSGTLAAGGTVSGWIYFKGDTVKALYFSSMLNKEPAATWNL